MNRRLINFDPALADFYRNVQHINEYQYNTKIQWLYKTVYSYSSTHMIFYEFYVGFHTVH